MSTSRWTGFARLWIRYEPLLLLALPIALAVLVCSSTYTTDPDAYFHLGCARRIVEGGCIRSLPELPYTTLAEPFPNLYLGQHLLLAPIVWLLPPTLALEVGVLAMASGLASAAARVTSVKPIASSIWRNVATAGSVTPASGQYASAGSGHHQRDVSFRAQAMQL